MPSLLYQVKDISIGINLSLSNDDHEFPLAVKGIVLMSVEEPVEPKLFGGLEP